MGCVTTNSLSYLIAFLRNPQKVCYVQSFPFFNLLSIFFLNGIKIAPFPREDVVNIIKNLCVYNYGHIKIFTQPAIYKPRSQSALTFLVEGLQDSSIFLGI